MENIHFGRALSQGSQCDYNTEQKNYLSFVEMRLAGQDNIDYAYHTWHDEASKKKGSFRNAANISSRASKTPTTHICDHEGLLHCKPNNECGCYPPTIFDWDEGKGRCVYRKNPEEAIRDMKAFIVQTYYKSIAHKATLVNEEPCSVNLHRMYSFVRRIVVSNDDRGGIQSLNLTFTRTEHYLRMAIDISKSDIQVCNNWQGYECPKGICVCHDSKSVRYMYDFRNKECRVPRHHLCHHEDDRYHQALEYGNTSTLCQRGETCFLARKVGKYWEAYDVPCKKGRTCVCKSCMIMPTVQLLVVLMLAYGMEFVF